MSNVKLPQKAGFAPTVQEWDALVRIAENLAAQVVQAQAECDAAKSAAGFWGRSCAKIMAERDAARAEVARLTEELKQISGFVVSSGNVKYAFRLWTEKQARVALRGQPAPARAWCKCGHWNVDHSESDDGGRRVCMHLGCDCIIDPAPAPAGGEARP